MIIIQHLLTKPTFFFWLFIAAVFSILWFKSHKADEDVKKIKKKDFGRAMTENGSMVFLGGIEEAIKELGDIISYVNKLSSVALIILV